MKQLTYHRQTIARDVHRGLRLPVISPYFQRKDFEEGRQTGRDKNNILTMIKAFILNYNSTGTGNISVDALVIDSAGVQNYNLNIPLTFSETDTDATLAAKVSSAVSTYCSTQVGFTPDAIDVLYATPSSVAAVLASFAPIRTVTTPTRALNTAYQPSTTLPTLVVMSVEQDASLTLSGGAKGNVQMLISPTSSFTTSTTEDEAVNGNTGTVVVGIATAASGGAPLIGFVPAGYYYKVVSTNSTGTETFTALATTEIVGI